MKDNSDNNIGKSIDNDIENNAENKIDGNTEVVNNTEDKKPKKKTVWIIVLVISAVVLIVGGIFLFRYFSQRDVKREDFTPTEPVTEAPTAAPTKAPTEAPTEKGPVKAFGYTLAELGDFDVDFDELNDINTDIYAWLYIPGTEVDYPVAQSIEYQEDDYYLDHNIYRQYQFSGTIYSQLKNHLDFHDPVTVLYGHNMLNGSMFATLHRFEDSDFFDEHNTAFVLTKDKVYTYLIYSAYVFDDRHILNTYNFAEEGVFQEYLDSTLEPHSYSENVREGVKLNTSHRILTLSTCTNGASNTRYLVQGVLADERKR